MLKKRGKEGNNSVSLSVANNSHPDIKHGHTSLRGDRGNLALLVFLYVLQGIPLGLIGSVPMLLQNRKVSYREQAEFSLVYWPFSLKLLWAPIVDAWYSSRMGRRKTWLVPTQYLLGLFMLLLSGSVTDYLGGGESGERPNVAILTALFFLLNFLAATQDIAVDGWALTMLQRHNVGHASTCNSVGQTTGYFLGYVVFMALESADFCNNYLRSEPSATGILTLSDFLYFWGIVFLVTTTFVWIFKSEKSDEEAESDEPRLGIVASYKLLWKIVMLPNIKVLLAFLLTCKIGFAAADAVTGLKLVESGVPKERLALLAIPMVPLQILLPLFISKYTAGPRPMALFMKAVPYRLMFSLGFSLIVWVTPAFKGEDGLYPAHYYGVLILIYAIHQVALYSMFVAVMAFFAKVSDPAVGGTYMTLLNTVCNLGGNWPTTLALWLVDPLTWKLCSLGSSSGVSFTCDGDDEKKKCVENGGACLTSVDGYYVESIVCCVVGFLWLRWGRKSIAWLHSKREASWRVVN